MKRITLNLVWLIVLAIFVTSSCKKDEVTTDPILVEDGIYLVGEATNYTELNSDLLMSSATNEKDNNAPRDGMFEIFTTLETGKTFYISEVAGKVQTKFGPSAVANDFFSYNPLGKAEQPNVMLQMGAYTEGSTTFTVPESGLYHIILDKQLGKVAIVPVKYWAIYGAATPTGWASEQKMELVGAFNKTEMIFKITDLVLRQGVFKLRYNTAWKLQLDDTATVVNVSLVKVNTNFGGTLSALVSGGSDIAFAAADEGKYTVEMKWTLASGFTASLKDKVAVEPLPTYPAMYIVGGATAYGWDAPGPNAAAIMHRLAGGVPNEGIFWKICFLTGGEGFKLAAANWGDPNLGFSGVTSFDVDGVTVSDNGGNMSVATSGMYIVVLNLRDGLKKVSVKSAAVYGIGDCFGGFTKDVPGNMFTIDNGAKTLVSPSLPAAGNIRMYASHTWIPDWWHAEFRINGTALEYRNDGGDQTAVAGTIGQIITLHFDDNTGSIAK